MKALKWVANISAIVGIVMVILGSVSAVFHLQILQVRNIPSYFQGANSFFLLTIVIFLFIYFSKTGKE